MSILHALTRPTQPPAPDETLDSVRAIMDEVERGERGLTLYLESDGEEIHYESVPLRSGAGAGAQPPADVRVVADEPAGREQAPADEAQRLARYREKRASAGFAEAAAIVKQAEHLAQLLGDWLDAGHGTRRCRCALCLGCANIKAVRADLRTLKGCVDVFGGSVECMI